MKHSQLIEAIPEPSTLKPGQRKAIKIKIQAAEDLRWDIERQIRELEYKLRQAQDLKQSQQAKEIEGLVKNLAALDKNLKAKIAQLQIDLKAAVAPPAPVVKLFDTIQSHCGQYLAEVKRAKHWLYRGASGSDQFVARSWESRRPKDSSKQAQILFDNMLKSLGFEALRSNSIFATSDFQHAGQFGDQLYVIFPIDGFKFTYTKKDDVTLEDVEQVGWDTIAVVKFMKPVNQWAKAELAKAKTSNNDSVIDLLEWIIDDSKSYYFWSWERVNNRLQELSQNKNIDVPKEFLGSKESDFVTQAAFLKTYAPKQTNLADALKKGVEVYIHGTYFALSFDTYDKWISEFWGVKTANPYGE